LSRFTLSKELNRLAVSSLCTKEENSGFGSVKAEWRHILRLQHPTEMSC